MHVERSFMDTMFYQYFLYDIINLCFVTLTLILPCKINTILVMVVFILCSKAFKFQGDLYLMDEGEQNQCNTMCRWQASIETNFILWL